MCPLYKKGIFDVRSEQKLLTLRWVIDSWKCKAETDNFRIQLLYATGKKTNTPRSWETSQEFWIQLVTEMGLEFRFLSLTQRSTNQIYSHQIEELLYGNYHGSVTHWVTHTLTTAKVAVKPPSTVFWERSNKKICPLFRPHPTMIPIGY